MRLGRMETVLVLANEVSEFIVESKHKYTRAGSWVSLYLQEMGINPQNGCDLLH